MMRTKMCTGLHRVAKGSISSLRDSTFFFEKCFLDTTAWAPSGPRAPPGPKALPSALAVVARAVVAFGTVGFWNWKKIDEKIFRWYRLSNISYIN